MKYFILVLIGISLNTFADIKVNDTVIYKQENFEDGQSTVKIFKNIVTQVYGDGGYTLDLIPVDPPGPTNTVTMPGDLAEQIARTEYKWLHNCTEMGGEASTFKIGATEIPTCIESEVDEKGLKVFEMHHADLPFFTSAHNVWYSDGKPISTGTVLEYSRGE